MNRRFRLLLFAFIYFVQGSALAYFRNFQKPYLDSLHIDADTIGLLTSILLLPFILKIFIGMFSDKVNLFGWGHRKPYIFLGLLFAALAFGSAGFVLPDRNFLLFATLITFGSFSVTLFDSTTDGLAIDVTPENEQGHVQGAMVGGRAAGFIILSLVFGFLVAGSGYRVIFTIIAVIMLIPLFLVSKIQEPKERPPEQIFQWRAFKSLVKPAFFVFALYAIVYSLVSFGVDGLVTFFMSNQLDASSTVIGQYGAMRGVGAVLGAGLAALLVDRMGRRISAYLAAVAVLVVAVIFGGLHTISLVIALGLVWGLVWGFQETVFVALAMHISDTRIAATMFALMMAFSNIGTAIGEGVATGLTDNMGFSAVFWLLAAINLLVFPILWVFFRMTGRSHDAAASSAAA